MSLLIIFVAAFAVWGLGMIFLPVFEDIEGPGVFLAFSFAVFICTLLAVGLVMPSLVD